jgi:hypothetical protein
MTNKMRQEIIDYLEEGDKFADILIRELDKPNLTCYEKRTYSSLLDAMNGATELYCAMTEHDNVISFNQEKDRKVDDEDIIVIQHGLKTMESVYVLESYIKELPLSAKEIDKLVALTANQLFIAENESFIQGFITCMDAVHDGGFKGLEHKVVKVAALERGV